MDYPKQKLSKYQIEEIKKFNNNIKVKFENTSCLNCQSNNDQILFKNDRYGFKLITVICKKCGLILFNVFRKKLITNYILFLLNLTHILQCPELAFLKYMQIHTKQSPQEQPHKYLIFPLIRCLLPK